MIFVEYTNNEVEDLPSTARPVEITNSGAVKLAFSPVSYTRTAISAWLLGRGPSDPDVAGGATMAQLARNIRLYLLRLHAEYETLKKVLPLIKGNSIKYERGTSAGAELSDYLNEARKWLFSAERYGVDQAQMREVMLGFESLVTTEDKPLILKLLDEIQPQNLKRLAESLPARDPAPIARPDGFDVFISYNSQDRNEVTGIVRRLQACRIRTWFDVDQMPPGAPLVRALEDALGQVRVAAVFLGDQGLGRWEGMERETLVHQFVQSGVRIIPVILSSASQTPVFPLLLQGFSMVDLRTPSPPDPLNRLCWEITGKPLDQVA
jgi:hypothetical protein